MLGNNWHKKEMPLVSLAGMGGGLSSPAFLSSLILNITKPTVFSPVDDTGVPDFTYNALSSAITNVGQVVSDVPIVGPDENYNGGTSYAWGLHSVYDPSTQRIVIAYTDWTNNEHGTYVVGQVDGDSITFGTPATFRNSKCINIRTGYDPVNEKVYIAFVDGSNGSRIGVIAGDVDPTTNSINFGGYISLHGRGGGILGMAYDTTNQNMVVAYHDDTVHRGKIECVTMRDAASNLLGNGPQSQFGYGIVDNISNNGGISSNIVYDPNANRIVIAYSGMDDYDGKVVVGEGTGGSWNTATVNFGSPVRFDNLGIYSGITYGDSKRIRMVYNPDAQKIIIGYRLQYSLDNINYISNAQVIAGTVDPSANTVNFGNSTVFGDFDPRELEIGYDSNSQKMMLVYHPYIAGETNRLDFVAATIDGTTISVEDPVNIGTYPSIPYYTSIAYDSSNQKFVVSHTTNSTGGIANVVSPVTIDPQLTLTDIIVSKASDGSLIEGATINEVLTVGERIQSDTPVVNTVTAPVFSTTLYQSGSGNEKTITTSIDNTDKSLIWIKGTTLGYHHKLMDSERGSSYPALSSDNANPETGDAGIKELTSNGFVLHGNGYDKTNDNKNTSYVAWNFRAAPGFFDVVTYIGDGTGSQNISHNLGTTPGLIMVKRTDTTADWWVYHSGLIANDQLKLNTTDAAGVGSFRFGQINVGLDINPSSFTVGGDDFGPLDLNQDDATYVAYVFADNTPGLIKCGSYSSSGEVVNLGFRPQWLMIKSVDNTSGYTGDWRIFDTTRGIVSGDGDVNLWPNEPREHMTGSFESAIDLNENGFTVEGQGAYGSSTIYVAIAEGAEADIPYTVTPEATISASSGNVITLSDVSGAWSTGMRIRGIDLDLKDYPDAILAQDISLTSSSPTAENTVNTWGDAVWEIATDAAFTQNVQTSSTALSASGTQSGPTFSYNSNTGYYVRTKYTALGQESEWSDTNYFVTQLAIDIEKPIILTPTDGAGLPDFDYTAESSAITNVDSQTTLDDFTGITSLTGRYEYIASDPNGSVFVTGNLTAGSNYFDVSTDGGVTWSTSNTVPSWANLRPYVFVDSPTYKGFIFGSVLSGMGGSAPTYKSSQGNYLSWSQAGTLPSYQSDRGRYDAFATDNDGFIVACGSYSNVAYSTNNADSWTRVSPGSGGTNTSTPQWMAAAYFAKEGKFIITTGSQSASGNKIYLTGDKSQVQSGNWTIHDSASSPPGIDDMGCNDDYLFALSGSWSGSSLWRTSDLTSWTKIADFGVTDTDKCPYNIKVKGSTIILIDTLYRGPNTGDIIVSTDNGANWIYKRINPSDTFGSFDAAIDGDNNIVAVNDRKSPRVARTKLNANTILTLTDTTVSKISDGSLIDGTTISQALTVGETVRTLGDDPHWIATLGIDPGNDHGHGIDIDSSGNVYICGRTNTSTAGNHDAIVAKYNSSGSIQWQRMLGGSDADEAYDIAVDNSGNSYICGRTSGNDKALIAKYDTSGNLVWQRTLEGPSSTYAEQIALDSSGNPHICGRHQNDLFIAKYNSSGTLEWQKGLTGYGGPGSSAGYESGNGLAIDSLGNIYVSGDTNSGPGTYDAMLIKYDSLGNELWQKTVGGGGYANSGEVQVDSSDNLYLCGYDDSMGHVQAYVIKYNSSGTEQWQRMVGGSSGEYCYAMAVDNSGNVYLAGTTSSTGTSGGGDYLIVKYDSLGNLQWQRLLGGSTGYDSPFSIVTDSSDNFYINGYCRIPYMTMVFAKLPGDGSLTGTYGSLTYSEINYNSSTSTLTTTPISVFTPYDSTMNDAEGTLTPDTSDLTSSTTIFAAASGTVSASSGNTITLSNVSGTWLTGMKVQGVTTDTKDYPGAISSDDVSLTSSEPSSPQTLPSGYSWDTATWQVATDENFTQNVQTETSALSATGTQTGPSFSLQANTGYYTRTKYTALGQESAWSDVTYFITKPKVYVDDLFSTALYTGNGNGDWNGGSNTVQSGLDFTEGDWLSWIKLRNAGDSHFISDSTQKTGTMYDSWASDRTYGKQTGESTGISAVGTDSYTIKGQNNQVNGTGKKYVAWNFKTAPGFFDIQTWTGDGVEDRQIPHNLGTTPGMIIIKRTGNLGTEHSVVYHRSLGTSQSLTLSSNVGKRSYSYVTSVSDTAFGVSMQFQTNGSGSGAEYVAYIFAHDDQSFGTNGDEAIIKCGSYNTPGDHSAVTVDLGFEPQFLLFKSTADNGRSWFIFDTARGITSGGLSYDQALFPNTSDSETSRGIGDYLDITPTGFIAQGGEINYFNAQEEVVYMAIHRPHKPPTSATEVFAMAQSVANAEPSAVSGFPVDMAIRTDVTTEQQRSISARLMEGNFLYTNNTNTQASTTNFNFDYQNGVSNISLTGYDHYMFKRAPGFFDVTTWVGTESNKTVNHNLGVVPELVIVRNRDTDRAWMIWSSYLSDDSDFLAFTTGSYMNDSNVWQANSTFTSTQFGVGSNHDVNKYNDNLIAFLFASLDGISKIGTFSGTGSEINVDCGFTAGARFVMIKRIDAGRADTHWYVFDTMHGIISGNDNYFALNDKNAYSTSYNYIDPLNAGFTVTSAASANSGLNEDGATYLFLAIA